MRDMDIVPFSFSCLLQMMDLLVFGDASITLRGCRLDVKGMSTARSSMRTL